MPVNLSAPDPAALLDVRGIEAGVAVAGIRKKDRRDLLVLRLAEGATVAGVFTRNRFCAAPVIVARGHLGVREEIRALVVNTGNANAGTGEDGITRATAVCSALAELIGCRPRQVLPFSTGVIMEPLPIDPIVAGLPSCVADLRVGNWSAAAATIMTTDTVPKATSATAMLSGGTATVTGIAKGAGMIRPDMATMLGFVATDAHVGKRELAAMVKRVANRSFNRITVDGDTSTNDAFMLIASGVGPVATRKNDRLRLEAAVTQVAERLAQSIVRDGEGATKFVTIRIEGAKTVPEARRVADAIAHSPLVKTAFFASDPNLGRILAAIGRAGVPGLDVERVDLWLDEVRVATRGARDPNYLEAAAAAALAKPEFTVRARLGRGRAATTVWTCDLSYEYVKINAEYRT